ncbi:2-hydroxy-palmitic acid dioxygenase mpo1-like [Tasmannia lanceolata]|uniref:2-hydroxy-palmitic acid dioxygenase mpo1-like n=1 Tax=Tasmannia lanceolata TaxID=3420 RepID=UPI00406489F2
MGKRFFDLEKHFAFHGAYHSNPINILMHVLFVWPIFYTSLVLLYFTPPLFNFPQTSFFSFQSSGILVLNFGFLFALIYATFYVFMDIKAGTLAAILCFLCWVSSSHLANQLGFSLAWRVVLAAQLICWTGSFIGHGVFEKRTPALRGNLSQAFLMEPFFIFLEVLQKFCDYEPYPGFHASVKAKIETDHKEWQEKGQKKIA